MNHRILTVAAVAAMLLTAAAASAKRNDAPRPPKPSKADPAACIQMDLTVTELQDGSFQIDVAVAEECKGALYADLTIEVDGQPVADAMAEGVSEFAQEAALEPQAAPFEVCAELYGELRDRKKSKRIDRKECTLAEPGGSDA